MNDKTFYGLMIGIIIGAFIMLVGMIFIYGLDSYPVDVPVFGEKLCSSQGYSYERFTMDDHVPTIYCTANKTTSVYDGVVVLEKN